ncbi:hypothetical protein IT40_26645 [Paracoccus versutus]|nr:hypothetical protein IT40_26645 [Paracoccus versutus]
MCMSPVSQIVQVEVRQSRHARQPPGCAKMRGCRCVPKAEHALAVRLWRAPAGIFVALGQPPFAAAAQLVAFEPRMPDMLQRCL